MKVISGDNAVTVANIAKKAGLDHADRYVDASTLETEEDVRRGGEGVQRLRAGDPPSRSWPSLRP